MAEKRLGTAVLNYMSVIFKDFIILPSIFGGGSNKI